MRGEIIRKARKVLEADLTAEFLEGVSARCAGGALAPEPTAYASRAARWSQTSHERSLMPNPFRLWPQGVLASAVIAATAVGVALTVTGMGDVTVPLAGSDFDQGSEGWSLRKRGGASALPTWRNDGLERTSIVARTSVAPVDTDLTWKHYGGHRYLLSSKKMLWSPAQGYAHSLGGYLVSINDGAEQAWLTLAYEDEGLLWIGYQDVASEGT